MTWLRLYHSILQDPKIVRLSPENRWYYVGLLAVSSQQNTRGLLPSVQEIAIHLRVRESKAARILSDLHAAGLLDKSSSDHDFRIHGWEERQPVSDNVASRVKRYRDKAVKRNGNGPDGDTDGDRDKMEEERTRDDPNPKTAYPDPVQSVPMIKADLSLAWVDRLSEQILDWFPGRGLDARVYEIASWEKYRPEAVEYGFAEAREMELRGEGTMTEERIVGLMGYAQERGLSVRTGLPSVVKPKVPPSQTNPQQYFSISNLIGKSA